MHFTHRHVLFLLLLIILTEFLTAAPMVFNKLITIYSSENHKKDGNFKAVKVNVCDPAIQGAWAIRYQE